MDFRDRSISPGARVRDRAIPPEVGDTTKNRAIDEYDSPKVRFWLQADKLSYIHLASSLAAKPG